MSEASPGTPAPTSLGKPDAVKFLARQAGRQNVDAYSANVRSVLESLPRLANQHVRLRNSAETPGVSRTVFFPARTREIPAPVFNNGRPGCFPEYSGIEHSPAFEVLEIADGCLAQISRAPVVLTPWGDTLIRDFSSPYAGLVYGFDFDLRQLLAAAQPISGTAVVLCDDVHPLNFSHWILDELPRLAFLGEQRDVTVVTSDEDRPFKRESLELCGFEPSQILYLGDFQAIRASRLLVPRDIAEMPHPAFKAAPWVMDFLRARLGFAALAAQPSGSTPAKLFVSRDDAVGRRIINEAALMDLLRPAGYHRVTLAGLSLPRQIALFARATHVLGAHGAGLTNFAFARQGAQLLELFPSTYGTPAYYVVAAGQGNLYATYIADDVVAGDRAQTDDFRRCCGALL
jgi:hypothetical protein